MTKLYVLYTSYPYEGGYIHGVFSSRELAEKYLNKDNVLSPENTYIDKIELNRFDFSQITV